ncbi:hypothetical protein PRK78_007090 [Emydomyces testavorans]|uniref:Alcohol dehydrogenase-like N-terminal domain-containing protein n=1 Tax=Emydomyces testavorans TaxID=2070801 RepID=A0AAF0DMM2_9EURO|nr:hypothetical protein PRK78_007090 [Emydomyces testavorans]
MSTMKEAFASVSHDRVKVFIKDSPIPEPNESQLLIRVVATGLNPKDWKYLTHTPTNQGDDVAGYVHSVGNKVTEFKPGDRVAALHQIRAAHGGYAEYAVVWAHTTFHLPKKTSFEAMTAALGLYQDLCLPIPWNPARTPTPLIVYGGASAVGSFVIKLANLSNIHPIIAVAGKSIPQVKPLLDPSQGDTIIDYRNGDEAVVAAFKEALSGKKLEYAFDAISAHNSYVNIGRVLDPEKGQIVVVSPAAKYDMPVDIKPKMTYVATVHEDGNRYRPEVKKVGPVGDMEFGSVFFRFFGLGLSHGWFWGHRYRLVEKGLEGIEAALNDLKEGHVSGFKYVVRIADTPGLEDR